MTARQIPAPAAARRSASPKARRSPSTAASPCCAATSPTTTPRSGSAPPPASCCSTPSHSAASSAWPPATSPAMTTARLRIRFGHPPAPVPEPFASLLHQLVASRRQPATSQQLAVPRPQPRPARRLRHRLHPATRPRLPHAHRTDLRAPPARPPSPRPRHRRSPRLPLHHHQRQHTNAGATWTRYPAGDHTK